MPQNKTLLGIHVGSHDANLSVYDGKTLKYFKYERETQIKKFAPPKHMTHQQIVENFLKQTNTDRKLIEAIAIGDATHWLQASDDKYEKIDYLSDICNEAYFVDHHYAHHLSYFETEKSWVLDGHSNSLRYSSIINNNKIIETLKDPEHGYSLGECLAECAFQQTGDDTNAGHIMALDSLGKTNEKYFHKYKDYPLDKSNIYYSFIKYLVEHRRSHIESNYICDYVKTVHEISKVNHLKYAKKFFSKQDKFLFTGGVSQSIILNTHFREHFPNIVITPHGYDGGISLGLINCLSKIKGWDLPKIKNFPFIQTDEHPGFPNKNTIKNAAEYLAKGKIVLWFQGNGEIGPRALGNRSILANPMIGDIKEQVNEKVKKRAWYRPYGASVIVDKYKDYFDLKWESPYMLYQAQVKDKQKLKSITHFDGTCRIQTVSADHEVFYDLLCEFEKLTGLPILLNTSLNLPGKPIAGFKKDAKSVFDSSQADMLVMGNEVYTR